MMHTPRNVISPRARNCTPPSRHARQPVCRGARRGGARRASSRTAHTHGRTARTHQSTHAAHVRLPPTQHGTRACVFDMSFPHGRGCVHSPRFAFSIPAGEAPMQSRCRLKFVGCFPHTVRELKHTVLTSGEVTGSGEKCFAWAGTSGRSAVRSRADARSKPLHERHAEAGQGQQGEPRPGPRALPRVGRRQLPGTALRGGDERCRHELARLLGPHGSAAAHARRLPLRGRFRC